MSTQSRNRSRPSFCSSHSVASVTVLATMCCRSCRRPEVLRKIDRTFAVPASHVFEGMRAILIDGGYRADLMWNAILLNGLYLALGCGAFFSFFRTARVRGLLLNLGE